MIKKTEMGICPACNNGDCEMIDVEMDVDCLWTCQSHFLFLCRTLIVWNVVKKYGCKKQKKKH